MPTDPSAMGRSGPTLVAVPDELVPELSAEHGAVPIPALRSSIADAALIVGANATSVVAMVLTTKAVAALSRVVNELLAAAGGVDLQGQFGSRQVEFGVTETNASSVADIIAQVEPEEEIDPYRHVPGVRAFISYAHDNAEHKELVRQFWVFLRQHGIDARIDLWAARQSRDWTLWAHDQIRSATHVLMIASPAFKRRAEGAAAPDDGRGVQWEAQFLRELRYRDPAEARRKQLSIVLPGRSATELPDWASPMSGTHYTIRDFSEDGAYELLELFKRSATWTDE